MIEFPRNGTHGTKLSENRPGGTHDFVAPISLWEKAHWSNALVQFARASGLTISVYDASAVRRFGPITHHPLAHLIADTGAWEQGPCRVKDEELVRQCLTTKSALNSTFGESMAIQAFPMDSGAEIVGVVVVGWALDQFADPIRCARLAKTFGIPENVFWMSARESAPIGRERFTVFLDLLKTMVSSILGQLSLLEEARNANHVKDQFLATASHELKTPLTSMQLKTQMLLRQVTDDPVKMRQGLVTIDRGIKTLIKLVEDLLETSRVATGKLKLEIARFYPTELASAAVETILPSAEAKGIELTSQLGPVRLEYRGDLVRLQQVYWNLLTNAVKFTPPGGYISVTGRESKGFYWVEVRDSGRGIDEELVQHLFKPFFQIQADGANNGLGLGLSVVKAIIELHGGQIEVSSEGVGLGASFRVGIPATSAFGKTTSH